MKHVSGFVSILGRPNAGKSTLLNALCGHKLAIVSDKPQTTRTAVQGVVTEPEAQIIFLDTPGIHQGNTLFNKRMMEVVRGALQDRDVLLFLDDCMHPLTDTFLSALDLLEGVKTPALLALNKIDALDDKRQLLPRIERYRERFAFAEYLPISAQTGEGLDKLKATVISRLPEGPEYFPPDFVTDQPERFLAGEIIREKILDATRQEVPHSVAVFVENWEDTPKLLRIAATVYVERPGQKAIIIGAKGSMLRKVGTLAREDLERMFSRKIFLELFVKVRPNWRESREFLNEIDWHSMAGVELESEENPLETDLQ